MKLLLLMLCLWPILGHAQTPVYSNPAFGCHCTLDRTVVACRLKPVGSPMSATAMGIGTVIAYLNDESRGITYSCTSDTGCFCVGSATTIQCSAHNGQQRSFPMTTGAEDSLVWCAANR